MKEDKKMTIEELKKWLEENGQPEDLIVIRDTYVKRGRRIVLKAQITNGDVTCELCGQKLKNKTGLKIHKRQVHGGD